MATKGVPIDFNNPEKYYCLKFGWVKRIKYIEESRDEGASLLVFFKKTEATYTVDGFFSSAKNPSPSMDLLLVEDMEKIPYSDRKRKVVQIAASLASDIGEKPDQALFALCDDGNIFVKYNYNGWEKLPDIPQD